MITRILADFLMERIVYNITGGISLLAYIWASCLLPAMHVHTHHTTSFTEATEQHGHAGHDHHAHHHTDTDEQAPRAPQPLPCNHHDSNCVICQHAAAKILTSAAFVYEDIVDTVRVISAESITLPDAPSLYSPLQRGPPRFA